MNYTTSVPIYLQVVDSIKEKIITRRIKPGEKLPSGRDLALQYTINPNTAARVYQTLEQEQVWPRCTCPSAARVAVAQWLEC